MTERGPYLKIMLRGLVFVGAFAAFTLTGLYLGQNKLIYPTSMPFQYPHQNPEGYRNPGERNLLYQDIETQTEDKLKLRGWFIH